MPKAIPESVQLEKLSTIAANSYTFERMGDYIGNKTRYLCTCLIDGHQWDALLRSLLSGFGCPACGRLRSTAGRTTKESSQIYKLAPSADGRYTFKRIGCYIGNKTRYLCTCLIDGHQWDASLQMLLKGSGCPKCARVANASAIKAEEIDLANRIKAAIAGKAAFLGWAEPFNGAATRARLRCLIDGCEWEPVARNVTNAGTGCPVCATHGYQPGRPGALYALHSSCGQWVKVGITNNLPQRLRQLHRATPFKFKAVMVVEGDGEEIAKLERDIHAKMPQVDFGGAKFSGFTEWREWNPALIGWLQEFEVRSSQ